MTDPPPDAARHLVHRLEQLEATAGSSYVLLDTLEPTCDAATVQWAIADDLLLVDHRTRLDPESGELLPVTLCRLNRRHPLVRELTAW